MPDKVTVIDYDRGNLFSVTKAFEHCGAEVKVTQSAAGVLAAERLVLPGVGAFGDAMDALGRRDLIEPVREYAASGRAFLGICVGMQLMFDGGEEFGDHRGLGLIPGEVVAIRAVSEGEQLMMMTKNGVVNRQRVSEISVIGRNTQGVKLMNLDKGDVVVDVARVILDHENVDELDGAEGVEDGADAQVADTPVDEVETEATTGDGSEES